MARQLQQGKKEKRSHSRSFYRAIALLLGVVILSEPLIAKRAIAQPAPTEQKTRDRNARISQLLNQATELNRQGTRESRIKAIALYEEALIIVREIGDRNGEAVILSSIGVNYSLLNEYDKAIKYHKQSLVIAQELKKPELEAIILSALGGSYSALGDRQLSINFFTQAVSRLRASNNPKFEAATLQLIGNQYLGSGETQKALDFYNQALDIQTMQKDPIAQAETLSSVGEVYIRLSETDKALNSYQQALKLQTGNTLIEANNLYLIHYLYTSSGEISKALDYLNQTLINRQRDRYRISTH